MWGGTLLFPESASTIAGRVDALYVFLLAVAGFFSLLIAGLVVSFAIRYRRRHPDAVGEPVADALKLEIAWTVVPFLVTLVIFFWGANIYFAMAHPPEETLNIYVVGKQWMWKIQHSNGTREINELHVPVGRAIKLIMTSEDVIHDFSIPAFRVKADVIPGRYSQIWFVANKDGRYHLFCAEYCGTRHSGMIGQVVVMEPSDYQTWLSGGAPGASLASLGERLFAEQTCNTCHQSDGQGLGPALEGKFGKTVKLESGEIVRVDEQYLRESILQPSEKVSAGYQPIMPAFQGLITEEGLLGLIEYIKSLSAQAPR